MIEQASYFPPENMPEPSKRIQAMIHHLRALGNKKPGVCDTQIHTVHDSVYQVLRAMQYEFPLEKVTVLKILPHDLLPSPLPRELLEMVIFELILNAREALGDVPGIITIEAADKTILSPENSSAGYFVLRVADTGAGVPQEYLEHLFDPGFTPPHGRRFNPAGLALVKKIVESARGLVRVETSLMGTSYFVELPR